MSESSEREQELIALAANLLALCNIAEVFAPGLLNMKQWTGLKAHHEEKAKALGVQEWIDKLGEEQIERIVKNEELQKARVALAQLKRLKSRIFPEEYAEREKRLQETIDRLSS